MASYPRRVAVCDHCGDNFWPDRLDKANHFCSQPCYQGSRKRVEVAWWRRPKWRKHHRLRQRVLSRRTEYELSWEVVEKRRRSPGTELAACAWESPIGGRIVRMGRRAYAWFPPGHAAVFDVPSRRACIEAGKRFATAEQLAIIR